MDNNNSINDNSSSNKNNDNSSSSNNHGAPGRSLLAEMTTLREEMSDLRLAMGLLVDLQRDLALKVEAAITNNPIGDGGA